MITVVVIKGDVVEEVRHVLKDALASPESRAIRVEAVEIAPMQLAPQREDDPSSESEGPRSKIGGPRSDASPVGTDRESRGHGTTSLAGQRPSREAEGPGDDRRPVHLNVVVKTTVNGKKAGNRLPKKSGEGRSAGEVNGGGSGVHGSGVHGSTVHGSGVQGSAGGDADGRGKSVSRGPDPVAGGPGGKKPHDGVLRMLSDGNEVVLSGETISLRNREKAKDFLREMSAKGATCRSKAVAAGSRFGRPAALFLPGACCARDGESAGGRELIVESEMGKLIQRVFREGVGKVPPAKKGEGPTRYYLRVFGDSDVT